MGYNARLNVLTADTDAFASVATNSSAIQQIFAAERAGQVVSAIFWNGSTSSVASGTTAGSAMNVYVYKTASSTTASVAASGALAVVATLGTQALTMSTATALTRFAAGDLYLAELIGGAGNNRNNAGAQVILRYMYGHSTDSATP